MCVLCSTVQVHFLAIMVLAAPFVCLSLVYRSFSDVATSWQDLILFRAFNHDYSSGIPTHEVNGFIKVCLR